MTGILSLYWLVMYLIFINSPIQQRGIVAMTNILMSSNNIVNRVVELH